MAIQIIEPDRKESSLVMRTQEQGWHRHHEKRKRL